MKKFAEIYKQADPVNFPGSYTPKKSNGYTTLTKPTSVLLLSKGLGILHPHYLRNAPYRFDVGKILFPGQRATAPLMVNYYADIPNMPLPAGVSVAPFRNGRGVGVSIKGFTPLKRRLALAMYFGMPKLLYNQIDAKSQAARKKYGGSYSFILGGRYFPVNFGIDDKGKVIPTVKSNKWGYYPARLVLLHTIPSRSFARWSTPMMHSYSLVSEPRALFLEVFAHPLTMRRQSKRVRFADDYNRTYKDSPDLRVIGRASYRNLPDLKFVPLRSLKMTASTIAGKPVLTYDEAVQIMDLSQGSPTSKPLKTTQGVYQALLNWRRLLRPLGMDIRPPQTKYSPRKYPGSQHTPLTFLLWNKALQLKAKQSQLKNKQSWEQYLKSPQREAMQRMYLQAYNTPLRRYSNQQNQIGIG